MLWTSVLGLNTKQREVCRCWNWANMSRTQINIRSYVPSSQQSMCYVHVFHLLFVFRVPCWRYADIWNLSLKKCRPIDHTCFTDWLPPGFHDKVFNDYHHIHYVFVLVSLLAVINTKFGFLLVGRSVNMLIWNLTNPNLSSSDRAQI